MKEFRPLAKTDVENLIHVIRGKQVLLDRDLAVLYGVETRSINQAVKRNIERFPEKNCFQLDKDEAEGCSKSQTVILNDSGNLRGSNIKKLPFAFTEQGVAMLASVLRSETAIRVSLEIMDAFVSMRHFLLESGGFVNRLSNVEVKLLDQDIKISKQDSKILHHERKLDQVFEAMDRGELKAKGLFYENQEFDAYIFVCNLIRKAKRRIVLVDNYVNEKILAMLLKRSPTVKATIYTYNKSKVFEADLATYNAQYKDFPLEIFPSYGIHDRFLFIDDDAYHFGASLKDLGKNTFFFSREDFTLDEVLKKEDGEKDYSMTKNKNH